VERIRHRLEARVPTSGPANLRAAAVLMPIVIGDGSETLLLTERSRRLRRQPGDIAFPDDASPLAAALRESREEVGLASDDVTVLGQMDERGTVTGFRITPFVATVSGPYPFRTNHEVERIIEVPIDVLADPAIVEIEKRRLPDGSLRDVYHYHFEEHDIWGITGQLIREFLDLID